MYITFLNRVYFRAAMMEYYLNGNELNYYVLEEVLLCTIQISNEMEKDNVHAIIHQLITAPL